MKKICILLILISVFVLRFFVLYPKNLGERTPIWEIKQRYLGEEYGQLRSEYFISLYKKNLWFEYDQNMNFYIGGEHDSLSITAVYLRVARNVAVDCNITTSGIIEWDKRDLDMSINANALTDDPLSVEIGINEYYLDESEDSIKKFEEETGMDAEELLDTVQFIRNEYRDVLSKISEAEYQKICKKIYRVILSLIIMWGIYIILWAIIRTVQRNYQKSIDESMKEFLDHETSELAKKQEEDEKYDKECQNHTENKVERFQ